MSGQQIGTVVGGVIGAYFGAPQLGMAIGGLIGGAIDPTKITGPHIGDGQAQSATDGTPISWVMGTMWVAGTIVDVGQRQEFHVKDPSQGKGSGTETYHYEAHQNFSIIVCESDELKGSTISQVLMVEQDGKIVYDVRPGSTRLGDSQKWLARNCIFYYGDEAQLPISADEAAHGVGNAPAYRAVLRAFFTQFNVTAVGDRIPNFRFLVASNATASTPTTTDFGNIAMPSGNDGSGLGTFYTMAYQDYSFETPVDKLDIGYISFYSDRAIAFISLYFEGDANPMTYGSATYTDGFSESNAVAIGTNAVQFSTGWYAGSGNVNGPSLAYNKSVTGFRMTAYRLREQWDDIGPKAVIDLYSDGTVSNASLPGICESICKRGGLSGGNFDVTGLSGDVSGYAVAKQMNAVSALGPLLGAYFAYASEYDSKINFHFYGADAVMTIDEADILAENDANNGNITSNLRNNATEFPKRIIGQYYDPAQNYMPVTVMQTRRAVGVTATGELSMDIPVVMPANQAQQAVDKALKVAYAQLEGTMDLSVPFAGKNNVYLSLVAGDPVIFRGKRWIVTEPIISTGYIKLTLQYDRQGAYTSDVQAIPGLSPTPPQSRYSGPTVIVPMNLPQLQTQDTYGLYVVTYSDPHNDDWRNATLQMSPDGGTTWQAVGISDTDSITGTLTAVDGGTSLIVQTNGDLSSVGSAQLDARQNAAALLHGAEVEILQYGTATEDPTVANLYTLTGLRRAELGTLQIAGVVGDQFITLDAAQLIPIDISFAGKTIQFRAVGSGENTDDAAVVSIVYNPDTTIIYDGGNAGTGT